MELQELVVLFFLPGALLPWAEEIAARTESVWRKFSLLHTRDRNACGSPGTHSVPG
ncbi:MAG: hypothetical protein WBM86_09770 [Waterburya sp.]